MKYFSTLLSSSDDVRSYVDPTRSYASKTQVGETLLYTRDNPGLVFVIPHCSRARPV